MCVHTGSEKDTGTQSEMAVSPVFMSLPRPSGVSAGAQWNPPRTLGRVGRCRGARSPG